MKDGREKAHCEEHAWAAWVGWCGSWLAARPPFFPFLPISAPFPPISAQLPASSLAGMACGCAVSADTADT
jgi:hypothetical protein